MQEYLLSHLYWISLFASICALLFAYAQAKKVLNSDEGTDRMKQISQFVRTGASAFLKRQYRTVLIFFAVMFCILCGMAAAHKLTWYVPFAFITGGFFSGLSGFIGMSIATRANDRTACAAQESLNKGLRVQGPESRFLGGFGNGLHSRGPRTPRYLAVVRAARPCIP